MSLLMPVILCIVAVVYHKQWHLRTGIDEPEYSAIFVFFWNLGDFYGDLIFACVLTVDENPLSYYCLFFSIVPYMVSIVLLMRSICQHHQTDRLNLLSYFYEHDVFLIAITIVTGFFTCIELARSKLFYLRNLSFQLKNSEYEKLQTLKFVNVVLFELRILLNVYHVLCLL